MSLIKKIEDVFTNVEIEDLRKKIRVEFKERYGESLEICEIAFGFMVNGISLVYLGEKQDNIEYVERHYKAQLAIDSNGEFVGFSIAKDKHSYFGYETYNTENDTTLFQFSLYRQFHIISSNDFVSTDDFNQWSDNTEISLISDYIVCKVESYYGKIDVEMLQPREFLNDIDAKHVNSYTYDDFEENQIQFDQDKFKEDVVLYRCWGWNRPSLRDYNISTSNVSRYIVSDRYLLLYDNLNNMLTEGIIDYENDHLLIPPSYQLMFERYKIDKHDLFKNRYGVYDIVRKKIIIHVGELKTIQAYISGFRRIDFKQNSITTYDFLDILANQGVYYSEDLSGVDEPNVIYFSSLVSGNRWLKAKNCITDYSNSTELRSGLNSGEWYIIREGKHAGRTLCWLLANGYYRDVINMIDIGYISFNNFVKFTYPLKPKQRDAIWLALDKHKRFENIQSMNDCLELEFALRKYSLPKYDELILETFDGRKTFEELVSIDPNYIIGLINKRSLYVEQKVICDLYECYIGNEKYLNNLKRITEALDDYNSEIDYYYECLNESEKENERWYQCSEYYDDEDYSY